MEEIKSFILGIREGRNFESFCAHLKDRPDDLKLLVELVSRNKTYPYPEWGTWILVHLARKDSTLLLPYYKVFVELLFKSDNQSVLRNTSNVLVSLKVSEYKEGELIEQLISFIKDANNKVALQVYSMQLLAQFVVNYPELKDEISQIIEHHAIGKSAAYHSGKKKFYKITKNI